MEEQTRRRLALAVAGLPLIAALVWIVMSLSGDGSVQESASEGLETAAAETEQVNPASEAGRVAISEDLARGADRQRLLGTVLAASGEPVSALVGLVSADAPVSSGADGRFELLVPADSASQTLLLLGSLHAPTLIDLDLDREAATHELGDLSLLAGGSIRGRIIDGAGLGLANARASLVTSGSSWPVEIDMNQLLQPQQTDAAGEFAFSSLMPGSYRVIASGEGLQSLRSSSLRVEEGLEVSMAPMQLLSGYALSGKVLGPDGGALAGAIVQARNGPGQPRYNEQVTSVADGTFVLHALPPGALRLEASAPGHLRYLDETVDASLERELVIRLAAGLSIRGKVSDASSGEPVEVYAVMARRQGDVDPDSLGSMPQQLLRVQETLRTAAANAADSALREQRLEMARQLDARMQRVRREYAQRAFALPANTGEVEPHPAGEFEILGLEEGLYRVGFASPEHQYREIESVELRLGLQVPELSVELHAGHLLKGQVLAKAGGKSVAGVQVELMRVLETSPQVREGQRSLYSWFFARSSTPGIPLMSAVTAADGRFEFRNAAPGRSFLALKGREISDHESDVFYLGEGLQEMRLLVGGLASVRGQVRNLSAGTEEAAFVLAIGGHGRMETAKVAKDGSYRFEGLSAGSYILRAYPASDERYVNRLFASIFPLWSGDVEGKKIPPRNLTLVEGQEASMDLDLDRPSTGMVQGLVRINGQPGIGGRAILRPVRGEALAGSGMSFSGEYDDAGRFRILELPAGEYRLSLTSGTRQELHSEVLTVEAFASENLNFDLSAGGLRGRVQASEALGDEELRGYLWVLPGASEVPADLYEYRRMQRTHRLRVRNGAYEDLGISPGPALLVLKLDGWLPVPSRVVIPVGKTLDLELQTVGREK